MSGIERLVTLFCMFVIAVLVMSSSEARAECEECTGICYADPVYVQPSARDLAGLAEERQRQRESSGGQQESVIVTPNSDDQGD